MCEQWPSDSYNDNEHDSLSRWTLDDFAHMRVSKTKQDNTTLSYSPQAGPYGELSNTSRSLYTSNIRGHRRGYYSIVFL
jgi:hypothetical protein